jgi:hypothetical protein
VQTEPALVGQGLGVALIGLAWLALHASIDGALTSTVAKVVGHVNWLTGVLMLVWLLGLHTPALTGFGQIVAVLVGVVQLVVGLGGVRLSGAVRRREKLRVTAAAVAERAERQAEKDAARDAANRRDAGHVTAGFPVYHAEPLVEPVIPVTSPVSPVAAAPVAPIADVDAPGLTASERAARADAAAARDDARDSAADSPGAPRPPFRG